MLESTGEAEETLSFNSMLKFTFIKLLKLYFTPITNSALMLVHCVKILGENHLYVYGDHICYSGWQLGIIVFILPCLLLFPVCFELALRLFKNKQINSWEFVLSSICPFYAISLYIWRRKCTANDSLAQVISGGHWLRYSYS